MNSLELEEKQAFKYFNASVFLHFIGRQIYNIFTPIILLKNGFDIRAVLLFFIISSILTIICSYYGEKIFFKKKVIYFNVLAIIAEMFLLTIFAFNKNGILIIALLALFEALYYSFYYLSYYAIVAHYTSIKRTGVNLGNLSISASLSSLIAPIIGSYLLLRNKTILIGSSIFFLTCSIMPLNKIIKKDINGLDTEKIKLSEIKKELVNLGIISAYEMVIYVLWGVYAYQYGISVLYIGLIPVISAIVSILFAHTIKIHINNDTFRKNAIFISVVIMSILSLMRFLRPELIIITNIFFSLFFLISGIGLTLEALNKMKDHQAYYSSMIISVVGFIARVLVSVLAIFIGLKNIMLFPIALMFLYFYINRTEPALKSETFTNI